MQLRRSNRAPLPALALAAALAATLAAALATTACSSTRPIGEQADDRLISSKVKAKLAGDPEINPFNIDVDTVEGVVTLTGRVDDAATRDEAVKHARETSGVRDVVDRIRVTTESKTIGAHVDDAAITTKVKAKLAGDALLNTFNIDVDTHAGVVTLSGRVATAAARAEAERLARETKGVEDVRNDLQVGDRTPGR
jgi:hyperosmotically inducible protein